MSKQTFHGGVHPYDGKKLTKDKKIREYLPKGDLVYPLIQHIGAPAIPVVSKGDHVLTGQLIAREGGFVSAPIYATVSGMVKGIEPRRVTTGDMVDSIIIENDGLFEEVEYEQPKPYKELTREEILALIQKAGVVGMGGAGFPTHVKLQPKHPEKIDYVIVNGAECEPYLTSDYRRMIEEPEKVVGGLKIMLRLFEHAKGIIAIEDNKPDCIEKMKALVKDNPEIMVKTLKTKYPQGAERQLIYATTRRQLNSTKLPADVGCIVDNIDTVTAIYLAVTYGRPLMNRIVTITGDAIRNPRNYKVRIGTSYQELIDEAGGFLGKPEKIISGGPMMGFALFMTDVPTTKTASALLCLSKDDVSRFEPSACIKCGRCLEACPARAMPNLLADYAAHGRKEEFVAQSGMECCECGSCSFVCPARRQLTQAIKTMRKQILEDRKKK